MNAGDAFRIKALLEHSKFYFNSYIAKTSQECYENEQEVERLCSVVDEAAK